MVFAGESADLDSADLAALAVVAVAAHFVAEALVAGTGLVLSEEVVLLEASIVDSDQTMEADQLDVDLKLMFINFSTRQFHFTTINTSICRPW